MEMNKTQPSLANKQPIAATRLGRRLRLVRSALPVALALTLTGLAGEENARIRFSEIGAKATADYQGDALGVAATLDGARLRCGFQKLEGHATTEGLWLESTVPGGGEFRLVATTVDREGSECRIDAPGQLWNEPAPSESGPDSSGPHAVTLSRWCPGLAVSNEGELSTTGTVSLEDKLVRFTRPRLTEEYSVSVDGVRQDFVITKRPSGRGDLRVELALGGARAEAAGYGAKVILESSGRALAYSRLRAEDAAGQELRARLEVLSPDRLAVRVADANATYPVRIDPTFSDANWVSLNPGMPGADDTVWAIAMDGSGNVYVGGGFTVIGKVVANNIAKWNGSAWSALGSGMNGYVDALLVSGTTLYAGGEFTTAGGVTANGIAAWNGSAWSALGPGFGGSPSPLFVYALAVSGTDLYAWGNFTAAGGVTVNYIAKWDGSAWSALGSGMGGGSFGGTGPVVSAFAADGLGHLFIGGRFSMAGTNVSPFIAQANIGAGMSGGQFGSLVYSPFTGFGCSFSDATIGQPYHVQTCSSPGSGSWTNLTNFTYTGPMAIRDPSVAAGPKRFYRAVSP